ncbi:hypothetical protein BDZ91DRAFT_467175 [Kalaharituber pfeilii]|nr:hypothetical protein BDZ91DRAFT_467175 [Kalaharituber pfeilii]
MYVEWCDICFSLLGRRVVQVVPVKSTLVSSMSCCAVCCVAATAKLPEFSYLTLQCKKSPVTYLRPTSAERATYNNNAPTTSIQTSKATPRDNKNLPQTGRAIVIYGIATTKKLGTGWRKANPGMKSTVADRLLVKKEKREGKRTR